MLNKRILTLVFVMAFVTLLVGCIPSPITENQAPIITSDPVKTATVGVAYTYGVEATDPDEGDFVIYSLTEKPLGMSIVATTGVISWTPVFAQLGDNPVNVVVSDGDLSVVQSFTIKVSKLYVPTPTKKYTITATADPGGSINPSGAVIVDKGSNKLFIITPTVFSRIVDVLVDSVSVGAVASYTFTNVTADHTIEATFVLIGRVYNQDKDEHYNTIQLASDDGNHGDTILVMAGTYNEGIIEMDTDLTIIGVTASSKPIINPTTDTGSSGDGRGWFRIHSGVTVNFENLVFDGTGQLIYIAVLYQSDSAGGIVENCDFMDIAYTPESYDGRGICNYGQYVEVLNCTFENIYRIGVFTFYPSAETLIEGCTYTGKGDGDWLDYGIEFGGGGSGTVDGCEISACTGIALVDGSTSAGILVTTYYGASSQAIITDNKLTDNTGGIAVGYDENDTSVVVAHYNNIEGNTSYGIDSTAPLVNATNNWWGDASGAYHPITNPFGLGDEVSDNITYNPWSIVPN